MAADHQPELGLNPEAKAAGGAITLVATAQSTLRAREPRRQPGLRRHTRKEKSTNLLHP
jgi:hypothetical protein